MTRRRWIADRVAGNRAWLTGQNAAHLARVLRAQPGQQFDIAVGSAVRVGVVVSVSPEQVEFELGAAVGEAALPQISIFLSVFSNRLCFLDKTCFLLLRSFRTIFIQEFE